MASRCTEAALSGVGALCIVSVACACGIEIRMATHGRPVSRTHRVTAPQVFGWRWSEPIVRSWVINSTLHRQPKTYHAAAWCSHGHRPAVGQFHWRDVTGTLNTHDATACEHRESATVLLAAVGRAFFRPRSRHVRSGSVWRRPRPLIIV